MTVARRILVAERDRAVRAMLVAVLTDNGYTVRTAATVERAVSRLTRERFDLVLTGTFTARPAEALQRAVPMLRAAGATPVVLLSTHPLDPAAVQAAGFYDLLHQPFPLDALEALLARWLP